MQKKIREIIVVEGRNDENAVKSALNAETIITHGHGINEETWKLIERAYRGPGIIVLTDPDYAGEQIRKRIQERFPEAKHAYLVREEAIKEGDIGIENATGASIRKALEKARCIHESSGNEFNVEDLLFFGLIGSEDAGEKRNKLGSVLGIGYGNGKTFLKRLNYFGITREEFYRHGQALFTGNDTEDKE